MVFNSVVFLFCFFPLALLAYYLVPGRGKNVVLLVESLLFYCWTGVEYLPLIVCLIVFNYLWGLLTARTKAKLKGLLPAVAVLVNLAALVYFKYANFLIDTLNRIGNFGLAALDVGAVLPLGISYYIFKIISYEADVYTGKVEAEKDPIAFAAYVLFFPQLIVGPIIKYRDMAPQLHNYKNRCNAALMERGVELFLFGLAKKVILADSIGALWTDIISTGGVGLSNVSTPLAWLGIIAYSLQLYFDFAGYSEMSNGLAALMGFDCAANFDLPYISASITEFWRRWHISLSTWFRDYVYFPLGGSRCGLRRTCVNIMVVFLISGAWHGASWGFLAWGALHGAYQVIGRLTKDTRARCREKLGIDGQSEGYKTLCAALTFLLVCAAWVLFRADRLHSALAIWKRIALDFQPTRLLDAFQAHSLGLDGPDSVVLLLSAGLLYAVDRAQYRGTDPVRWFETRSWPVRELLLAGLILLTFFLGIWGNGFHGSGFIYAQF